MGAPAGPALPPALRTGSEQNDSMGICLPRGDFLRAAIDWGPIPVLDWAFQNGWAPMMGELHKNSRWAGGPRIPVLEWALEPWVWQGQVGMRASSRQAGLARPCSGCTSTNSRSPRPCCTKAAEAYQGWQSPQTAACAAMAQSQWVSLGQVCHERCRCRACQQPPQPQECGAPEVADREWMPHFQHHRGQAGQTGLCGAGPVGPAQRGCLQGPCPGRAGAVHHPAAGPVQVLCAGQQGLQGQPPAGGALLSHGCCSLGAAAAHLPARLCQQHQELSCYGHELEKLVNQHFRPAPPPPPPGGPPGADSPVDSTGCKMSASAARPLCT